MTSLSFLFLRAIKIALGLLSVLELPSRIYFLESFLVLAEPIPFFRGYVLVIGVSCSNNMAGEQKLMQTPM